MFVRKNWLVLLGVLVCMLVGVFAYAQDNASNLQPYITSIEQGQQGMTLSEMLHHGGAVMVVLIAMSILMVALIIYNFIALRERDLLPPEFCNSVIQKLAGGKRAEVKEMCEANKKNMMARIILAGLDKYEEDPIFARESIEQKARTEINSLWRQIGYLSDMGTIAPLLGLLGTVLGMIQAFNVIAFQTAGVKPILLAGGVSQAMINTAAGLVVAIPAMIFFSYFKRKVQGIADNVEMYYIDMIRFLEE